MSTARKLIEQRISKPAGTYEDLSLLPSTDAVNTLYNAINLLENASAQLRSAANHLQEPGMPRQYAMKVLSFQRTAASLSNSVESTVTMIEDALL